jgi:hypothetical protein
MEQSGSGLEHGEGAQRRRHSIPYSLESDNDAVVVVPFT